MPVILRVGPYAFFFFSLENDEPPHVHVRRNRNLAKFWLEPVELANNYGFANHEITRLRRLVEQNRPLFLEAWHDFFGTED